MIETTAAPELLVHTWFNTDRPLTLSGLRGRVVVLSAFQVLCPISVASGVPQAQRIFETFAPSDVTVIGMHSTFEHHDALNTAVLKAFIQEYRLKFPIALILIGASVVLVIVSAPTKDYWWDWRGSIFGRQRHRCP